MSYRHTPRLHLSVCVLAALILCLTSSAWAQLPTATLLGTVTDPQGAVVPGATVTATHIDTGLTRTVMTGNDGTYRLDAMPVGTYEVQVSHAGFATETLQGLTLTVAQEAAVNVVLRVGSTSQSVTVTEQAPVMDTTNATLGGLVNNEKVEDLPLNGRNYLDLTLLQTGVNNVFAGTAQGGSSTQGILGQGADQFVSNGAPPRSNNYMLDGAIMQNGFGLAPTSASGTSLGVDGIKEFKVITNLFGAEYGLTMGSQTAIVSQSGTNSFHGDAFEFARNSAFDAKNYFDVAGPIPYFSRNQFGGALGGPIRKDKTFFFGTYEELNSILGLSSLTSFVPEAACHAPAGTTITVNNVPGPGVCFDPTAPGPSQVTVTPIAAQLLALVPTPNVNVGDLSSSFIDSFAYPHAQGNSEQYGQIRLDNTLSAADSFFVRYTIDNSVQNNPQALPGPFSDFDSRSQYLTASENHIFSSAIVNSARFSYSRFVLANTTGAPALFRQPQEVTGAPFTGGFNIFGGAGISVPTPQYLNQFVYTWSDDIFWTKGKHAFKFGTLINHFDQPQAFQFGKYGGLSFNSLTNLLQGLSSGFVVSPPASNQNRDYLYNTYGFYGEDDWKVFERLTVNLGFRYEFRTNITNAGVQQYAFRNFPNDNALNTPPAGTSPSTIVQNDSLHNFSPRVGFAWDTFGNGKLAVRGGFGIYYDIANIGAAASNGIFGTPPTSFQSLQFGLPPAPVCLPLDTCFPVSSGGPYPFAGATLSTLNYYAKQPYMLQYNLTVGAELPRNIALSVSYVGSRGIHLWNIMEGNPAVPDQTLNAKNPLCNAATLPPGATLPANCTTAQPASNTPGKLTWSCIAAPPAGGTGLPTVNPLLDPTNPNACRLNPYYGDYTINETTADSWYNSLQVSFMKSSGNWQFQTSYTFSKLIDDGQGQVPGGSDPAANDSTDPFFPKFDKGPSEYDATHQLEFNTTYRLPNISHGFLGRVGSGWWTSNIVSARTGFAFSPTEIGFLQSNDQNTYGGQERPDYVTNANLAAAQALNPNAVVYNKNKVRTGQVGQFYNPNMFTPQAPGTLGNVTRGILRGPDFFDWDTTLAKDTKVGFLGEAGLINLRADFFNILNHPNYAAPVNGMIVPGGGPNPSAGLISATANTSRQIQVSVRLEF